MLKQCPECLSLIENTSKQSSRQIYCTNYCRKNAHRRKHRQMSRVERKRSNLRQNDAVIRIVKACRKAGTVQILTGHKLESFIELMQLLNTKFPVRLDLCHIAPVKGKSFTGLFHPRNLFFSWWFQNRKHSNRYFSGGMYIKNSELLVKWSVSNAMSTNEILIKIEEFLGDIIPRFLILYPVTKSRKVSIINRILEVDSSASFDDLMMWSKHRLEERWAFLSHTRFRVLSRKPLESKYITYIDSVTRFINYGDERERIYRSLRKLLVLGYVVLSQVKMSQTFNKRFDATYRHMLPVKYNGARLKSEDDWGKLKELMYVTAFNTLQGKGLNVKDYKARVLSYLDFG